MQLLIIENLFDNFWKLIR